MAQCLVKEHKTRLSVIIPHVCRIYIEEFSQMFISSYGPYCNARFIIGFSLFFFVSFHLFSVFCVGPLEITNFFFSFFLAFSILFLIPKNIFLGILFVPVTIFFVCPFPFLKRRKLFFSFFCLSRSISSNYK